MGGKDGHVSHDTFSSNWKPKSELNKAALSNKARRGRGRASGKPNFVQKIKEFKGGVHKPVGQQGLKFVLEHEKVVSERPEDVVSPMTEFDEKRISEENKRIEDEANALKAYELYIAQREEKIKLAISQRQAKLQKIDLLHSNMRAKQNRPESSFFKNLNSNISKNSSFVKKLGLQLHLETKETLMKEFKTLNLTKYVTEAAYSIANSSFKLSDVDTIVQMCSALHQWYANFSPELLQILTKNLSVESKKRGVLRLIVELFIVGVYDDEVGIFNIFKEVFDPKELKSGNALPLVLTFVKGAGCDLLGIVPRSAKKKNAELQKILNEKESENQGLSEEEKQLLFDVECPRRLSPQNQKFLGSLFLTYYDKVSAKLVRNYTELTKMEKNNVGLQDSANINNNGNNSNFSKVLEEYEKFRKMVLSLADCLDRDFPELPRDGKTVLDEGNLLDSGVKVVFNDKYSDFVWANEEERLFYREMPDLNGIAGLELPNSSFFALETGNKKAVGANCPVSDVSFLSESLRLDENEEEKKSTSKDVTSKSSASITGVDNSRPVEMDKGPSSATGLFNTFMNNLISCSSKSMVDKLAIQFLKQDCKAWRLKSVNFILNNTGNGLDILKYFGRFLAIVNPYIKEMVGYLLKSLGDEFMKFYDEKDQNNIEGKLRNAHFFGELVKFGLCPPSTVFNLLRLCLNDFRHHNIDVSCALLEVCGRYLYCTPENNAIMSKIIENMNNLKISRALPSRMGLMIENAIASCKPSVWVRKNPRTLTPIELYIHKLIYEDLSKDHEFVLRQLRKLNWVDCESHLLKILTQVYKNKYQHFRQIAKLLAGLSREYYHLFVIKFVDELLENFRINLESNPISSRQIIMMNVHLMSELFNCNIIDIFTVLGVLYTLIRYKTSFDTGDSKQQVSNFQALINDGVRVGFVCTFLINISGTILNSTSEELHSLDTFFMYFQKFLFLQKCISYDSFLLTEDLFSIYEGVLHRYSSMEEILVRLAVLEKSSDYVQYDLEWSLPYLIKVDSRHDRHSKCDGRGGQSLHAKSIESGDLGEKGGDSSLKGGSSEFGVKNGSFEGQGKLLNSSDVAGDGNLGLFGVVFDGRSLGDDKTPREEHDTERSQFVGANEEDEEEIARMFDKFVSESIKQQSNTKVKGNIFEVSLISLKNKTKSEMGQVNRHEIMDESKASGSVDGESPEETMKFHVLTRRQANKSALASLSIPVNTKLVNQHLKFIRETTEDRECMKNLTMKLHYNIDSENSGNLAENFNPADTSKSPLKMTYAQAAESMSSKSLKSGKTVQNQ